MSNIVTKLVSSNCDGIVYTVPCQITVWIWRICPISLLVVGTVGNALNILVFTRRQMKKTPTTLYLLYLAISDTVFLWCSVLQCVFRAFKRSDVRNVSSFNCIFHDWLLLTSSGVSVYLLVLLTADRVIHTKWPIFARGKLTRKIAMILTAILLIVKMLFSSPLLFGYNFGKVQINQTEQMHPNGTDISELIEGEKCIMLDSFVDFRNKTWRYITLIGWNLIPMVIIFIGNSLIVSTLRAQRRRFQRSSNVQQEEESSNDVRRRNSATKTLFVLTVFFFVTVSPFCIFSVQLNYMDITPGSLQFSIVELVHAIVTNLLLCNFTFNFFLYSFSGSVFRQEWKNMINSYKLNCLNVFQRVCGLRPVHMEGTEDDT